MTDNLHNCGHITHLMTIICTFEVFSASCIRLFGRLSAIDVFNYFFAAVKSPATEPGCRALNVLAVLALCLEPLVVRFVLGAALRPHARSAYTDGRGPLDTRMVIVAPGTALDGVWPTTLPVATLSS